MKQDLNKVIIIGTDHHNVLGVVRCFGINGIKPYGIIVKNDDSPLWVTKSRYWLKTWVIKDESEILDVLSRHFEDEERKPVIVCCSDGAMSFVDMNLDRLSDRFIVPSLNGEQGAITRLMNKEAQAEFLTRHGIPSMRSQIIDFSYSPQENEFDFPVILKPVASVEGNKNDIVVCDDRGEFEHCLSSLRQAGYNRILVQHFFSNITEYVLSGAVSRDLISYDVYRNVRQWPAATGTGCYSELTDDVSVICFIEPVLSLLQEHGFQGTVDIEFFRDSDSFCVNEINWRTGGRNHVSLYTKEYSAYFYFLSRINTGYSHHQNCTRKGFIINECADIKNALVSKIVPFSRWISQLFSAKSYALWYWKDLKPVFFRYYSFVKRIA